MRWLAVFALMTGPAWGETQLDGAAITAALAGKVLTYDDGSRQSFRADGETIYTRGKESLGHWQVRGDLYCSVWPPSDHWACYAVSQSGGSISFTAGDGSASVGHVAAP